MTLNPDPLFWAGKRVLLTGHTGFKGAWLTLWLTRMKADVYGLALPPNTIPNLFSLASSDVITSSFADIRELEAVRARFDEVKPEIVFHLAAQALVRPSYISPVETYATNVMGTVHILEAARFCKSLKAVVIVTSDKVYENREWIWPYRETEPMGGYDPYSSSKGAAELVVSSYRRSFFKDSSVRIASARAGNVIGGGDWAEDRLIPDIIRAFANKASVGIRSPNAIRPWQHVLEPLSGYLMLAQNLAGANADNFASAWNFGPADEDCKPVGYIVDKMTRVWGNGAEWHHQNDQPTHEAMHLKVDSSKARTGLGWKRRLNLDDALDLTVNWYRDHAQGKSARDLTLAQIDAYSGLVAQ